jgi:uncharacterized protein YdcH (DUF465 family)
MMAIREELMAHDDSFRQLAHQHARLESQLGQLRQKRFLTSDEELEEVRLKKLKLHLKDEMEQMVYSRLRMTA